MPSIDRIVWLLESHFRGEITLDQIADHAKLSKFHVSRLFSMRTGQTVSGYLRARRLSEAAKQLADGAPDIMSVALDAGYGSHEAFTRAFRDHFGLTPEALRKRRSVENLMLTEPDKMHSQSVLQLKKPEIRDLQPMRLAGMRARYNICDNGNIPDLWQRFLPQIDGLDVVRGIGSFGVNMDVEGDPESFDYMCAVPVPAHASIPEELTVLDVPALKVAIFPHEGHVSGIAATCKAAFSEGLPVAGLTPAGPICFLEYYGPDFDGQTGTGTIELWMHIRA